MTNPTRDSLEFLGWGTSTTTDADITGYNEADYWRDGAFLGPDVDGIVPIYSTADGSQFPADARPLRQ